MIVPPSDKKDPHIFDTPNPEQPEAGSSTAPQPPPFEEAQQDQAVVNFADSDVFVPPGGEEPPPEFTPYEAEYWVTSDGTIVSHDPHLNEDGEALYRFLLSHSQHIPSITVNIYGDHREYRTREVQRRDNEGRTHWHTETETVTVVDFDFSIDLSEHLRGTGGPIHWSLPDEEPAYRGKMYKEVEGWTMDWEGQQLRDVEVGPGGRVKRAATKHEIKGAKQWKEEREAKGLPPWMGPEGGIPAGGYRDVAVGEEAQRTGVLKSSKTMRQWADDYCTSKKQLKEFTYEKIVYGWNFTALRAAIFSAVQSTGYSGNISVDFRTTQKTIHIRADNWLSRTLSNKWIYFLLWITLIYPFIWMFKRYAQHGGGKWEVCGGAYSLKAWQYVDRQDEAPPPFPGEAISIVKTDAGNAKLVGLREGEWFQQWEAVIKGAAGGRCCSNVPLRLEEEMPRINRRPAILLDGYNS